MAALSVSALAGPVKFHVGEGATTSTVQNFLNAKNFSVDQLQAVPGPRRVEIGPNVQVNVLLSEDFSKFTAGSEEAPDGTDVMLLENVDDYFNAPGWDGVEVYQAGGKAYLGLGVDSKGEPNPGYLMTPNVDLTQNQGVFRAKFRIKNANENAMNQGMQYFVLNNDPDNRGMMLASTLPMNGEEYSDVEVVGGKGVAQTAIMFFAWSGKMFVDEMSLEELIFPLNVPQNINMQLASANSIRCSWDAVEGATSYLVQWVQGDREIATATTEGTELVLSGDFEAGSMMGIYVTALNGDDTSYPGLYFAELLPEEVGAPLALEATNVTENGFTANWEAAPFAASYTLYLNRVHEVTEDGEVMTYMDEDFSEIPIESSDDSRSTVMTTTGQPITLDDYIAYPGWSVFLASVFKGVLAITNLYEAYGFPGVLIGPVDDYSLGGGKVKITGTAFTQVDDAVVKVGFGTLGVDPATWKMTVNYDEGAKEVEIATLPAGSSFEVELEGGAADKQIIFQITDAAEGGDLVAFTSLNISTELVKGDVSKGLYASYTIPAGATSYNVEVPFAPTDVYEYYLVGSFASMKSEQSNVITVKRTDAIQQVAAAAGRVALTGNGIVVNNPEGAQVSVFAADGTQMARTSTAAQVNVALAHGAYIVRIGNDAFKVVK